MLDNTHKIDSIKTFKNINFKKRDYTTTNVVFAQSKTRPEPSENWRRCLPDEINLMKCEQLQSIDGVTYFGYI